MLTQQCNNNGKQLIGAKTMMTSTEKQRNQQAIQAAHAILEMQHEAEALREGAAIGYGRFLGSGPLNAGKRKASCSIPGRTR